MEKEQKMRERARELRKAMTEEERKLWYLFLKEYPLQFNRQYRIGGYIVDFYCRKARLIVELDGSQHYEPTEQKKDARRTAYLESHGCRVVRYSNLDVNRRFRCVCEDIDRITRARAEQQNG